MVLLVVKRSESQQFLYDTSAETVVEEILKHLVTINNLRHKIQRLKEGGDEIFASSSGNDEDCNDARGSACVPERAETLRRTLAAAELLQHKDQVGKKVALTEDMLDEAVEDIRHAAAEAFPEGLTSDHPFQRVLDGTEDLAGTPHDGDDLDASDSELWFASKKLPLDSKLSQYVGRNEKTKVVVKLQRAGYGRPLREPAVDEETQKAMLAYYYKKQEDQKKLAADDTMYYDSAWANPRGLKNQFQGIGDVRLS